MSTKWAALPDKHANEARKGEAGLFAWSSMRPDAGVLIAEFMGRISTLRTENVS